MREKEEQEYEIKQSVLESITSFDVIRTITTDIYLTVAARHGERSPRARSVVWVANDV